MTLSEKTILITGGAGFIGSHLAETLAHKNTVIVYDAFTSSVVTPPELKKMGIPTVIHGDILDGKKLEKAMGHADIVFHLAVACVRLSLSQERYVHDVNATGTLSTLLSAKKAGVKRFIYISSSEVYGTAKHPRIEETHPIAPTTVYGMSKYVGELYTNHFCEFQELPAMIVRPFNTYGPRSHFDGVYGEVIPRFAIRALNGMQPIIFGNGAQTRDFTFVTDTVAGIIAASENDAIIGSAVNVAAGHEVSIVDIAKIICEKTGLPFHPIIKPKRPNDVQRHAADIKKAEKLFLYKPTIAINKGIAFYIQWLKDTYKDPKNLLHHIPDTNW